MSVPVHSRKNASGSSQLKINGEQRIRKSTLKPDEWAGVKSIVKQLYIDQGKTLEEVLDILMQEHNFEARVGIWGYSKNLSKAHLEEAAREARRYSDQGLDPPVDMTINGQLVPWNRVRRHFAKDKRYTCPWLRNEPQSKASIARIMLRPSQIDSDTELLLQKVGAYWSSTIMKPGNRALFKAKRIAAEVDADPNDILCGILGGMSVIRWGWGQNGRLVIDSACAAIQKVLSLEEPDLLIVIIVLFSTTTGSLENHDPRFAHIGRYFASMAREALGQYHPMTAILINLAKLELTRDFKSDTLTELMFQAMVDIVEKGKPKLEIDRWYLHVLKLRHINHIQSRLSVAEARKLSEAKMLDLSHSPVERNVGKLLLMSNLATSYDKEARECGDMSKATACVDEAERARLRRQQEWCQTRAEKLRLEIVELGWKFPGDHGRKGCCIHAAEKLAQFYFNKHDFAQAEKYYAFALNWALQKFGRYHVWVELLLRQCRALTRMKEDGMFEPVVIELDDVDRAILAEALEDRGEQHHIAYEAYQVEWDYGPEP
ncbi:hypothetical protein LTR41_000341 [Exophiala xenobiotica]|nr:hypothetical protein LTR41_000341 [Exophiala xenobiotica]